MRLRRLLLLFGLAAAPALAPAPLGAQPIPAPPSWQFSLTPYFWMPALRGSIQTPFPRIGNVTTTLSPASIISSIDAVPVMLAGEVRKGGFALSADVMYSTIRQGITTRDLLFEGGHSRSSTFIATILGTLRVVEAPSQALEVGWGARVWSMGTKISLNPGLLPGAIRKTTSSWADPLIAARYGAMLSPRFGVTAYGDVGGFGVGSRLTWQAIGSLDYHLGEATVLRAGWRYLTMDKTRGDFEMDLGYNGPFLAATFRF